MTPATGCAPRERGTIASCWRCWPTTARRTAGMPGWARCAWPPRPDAPADGRPAGVAADHAPDMGEVTALAPGEPARMFPPLAPGLAGVWIAGGARIDGRAIRDCLLRAAVARGARRVPGTATLAQTAGQVTGVRVVPRPHRRGRGSGRRRCLDRRGMRADSASGCRSARNAARSCTPACPAPTPPAGRSCCPTGPVPGRLPRRADRARRDQGTSRLRSTTPPWAE